MRLLLAAALLALAGCAAPDAPAPTTTTTGPRVAPPTAPGPATPAPVPPGPGDEDAWAVGDWWTWEVSSVGHETFRVTTVVAEAAGDRATVGYATLDEGLRALFFHVPPAGDVGASDLSWPMHGLPTRLVDLPLADGKTWQGELEGTPVHLGARAASWQGRDAFEVLGTYEGDAVAVELTYVPSERMATRISLRYGSDTAWGEARLVDSGGGHSGQVHVLAATDLLLAGAAKPGAPRPPDSFAVPPEATHVLLGCQMSGGPGAFRIHFVPPAGEPFACARDAASPDDPRAMQVLAVPAVAGEWRALLAPLGQGHVFLEAAWVAAEVRNP